MADKKIISDSWLFDYTKIDDGNSDNPAVLSTLKGYATLSGSDANRNRHFYFPRTKKGLNDGFWDKVLGSNDILKEKLSTKTLYGSSRHPGDGENPIPEFTDKDAPISHAIRDFKIDDKGVFIVMDVLNTQAGRELQTFIDYGSKIGISTRAYGELKDTDNGREPVLDMYHFVTWDAVTFPAFSETRMERVADELSLTDEAVQLITDSFDHDKFISGLKTRQNKSEARIICDYAGLDADKVLGEEEADTDKRKAKTVDELQEALDEAMQKVVDLEKQLDDKGSLPDESKLKDIKKAASDKVKTYKAQLDDATREVQTLTSELDEARAENDGLQSQLDSYKGKMDALRNVISKQRDKVSGLEDSLYEMQQNYDSVKRELMDSSKKVVKLNSIKDSLESKIKDLQIDDAETSKRDETTDSSTEERVPLIHNLGDAAFDKGKPVNDDAGIGNLLKSLNKRN